MLLRLLSLSLPPLVAIVEVDASSVATVAAVVLEAVVVVVWGKSIRVNHNDNKSNNSGAKQRAGALISSMISVWLQLLCGLWLFLQILPIFDTFWLVCASFSIVIPCCCDENDAIATSFINKVVELANFGDVVEICSEIKFFAIENDGSCDDDDDDDDV